MTGYKELLVTVLIMLILLPSALDARKSKNRRSKSRKETTEQITFTTPDSTGPINKEIYKKRSPEEIFEALHSVLNAMGLDMDEFNFERIHPHLKIVYALYNELRLLAVADPDSLFGNSPDSVQDSPVKKMFLIDYQKNSDRQSVNRDTSSSTADSSIIITTAQLKASAESAFEIASLKPVIEPERIDPSKLMKDKLLGSTVSSSFTLSWNDTSFSKYLLKFEIVEDSLSRIGWNIVFEKVDKMKNKTTKVHRYFDAGEFMISALDLVWLTEAVKRSEIEILNYFHAKKSRIKDSL